MWPCDHVTMWPCDHVWSHITRVWINWVRLPILHVVSWTGKTNISLSALFAPENLVSRDGFGSSPVSCNHVTIIWPCHFVTMSPCHHVTMSLGTNYYSIVQLIFCLECCQLFRIWITSYYYRKKSVWCAAHQPKKVIRSDSKRFPSYFYIKYWR